MVTKNQNTDTAKVAEPEVAKQAPKLLEIDELRKNHKIGTAIFAGVCAAQDWRPGKQISEEEFVRAVESFTDAPMDGKPRIKESEANK